MLIIQSQHFYLYFARVEIKLMMRPPGVEQEKDRLLAEKKRLEKEFEALQERKNNAEISSDEYEKRKHDIEREFVEVMDRLAQVSYLMGESQ